MLYAKCGLSDGAVFWMNAWRNFTCSRRSGGKAWRYSFTVFAFVGLNMFIDAEYSTGAGTRFSTSTGET